MKTRLGGIGIGFRRELAHALLADPSAVDFVEVVAETCRDRSSLREAAALREIWPVIPERHAGCRVVGKPITDSKVVTAIGAAIAEDRDRVAA